MHLQMYKKKVVRIYQFIINLFKCSQVPDFIYFLFFPNNLDVDDVCRLLNVNIPESQRILVISKPFVFQKILQIGTFFRKAQI